MRELEFRPLNRAHAASMHAINRACPIEADFTFFFDREPDFFRWPETVFDASIYIGGFRGERLVGYTLFASVAGHAGALGKTFGYMGDARVLPEERGHAFTQNAARALLETVPSEAITFSLLKRGNESARSALEKASVANFSIAYLCGFDAAILLLLRRVGGARRFRVRRAHPGDIPRLAALMERAYDGRLFAPIVTPDELEKDTRRLPGFGIESYRLAFAGDELIGALGAWDEAPVRRASVLRLSWRGKMLRAAYEAARVVHRAAVPLPHAAESFRGITTTRIAIPSGDPAVLHDLLAAVHDEFLGSHHMIVVGFTGDDPLASSLRGMLAHHVVSDIAVMAHPSRIEEVLQERRPYLDLRFV